MLLKTLLNRVQHFKGFVYESVRLVDNGEDKWQIEAEIRPRKRSKPSCSGCGKRCSTYDTAQETRRFEFVPLWLIPLWFVYRMRRVNCPDCGIRVERVPWSDGKSPMTTTWQWFLADWARALSWQETATRFRTTWDKVATAVRFAVAWGRKHVDLSEIRAIGVDEIQWQRGHQYLTLVYQIDGNHRRLLWVGRERTIKTLLRFFRWFGPERSLGLQFVCSDMWQPYLKVIAKKAKYAFHILDRFHIMKKINEAIDDVRRAEVARLKADGYEPVLKRSRWCLLKRVWNLTAKQTVKLRDLLQYNLKTVRAYLLKEDFHRFWEYRSAYWAERFLKEWCTRTMRSKIEPMKKVARSLRIHQRLILNWFLAQGTVSSGIVEGLNNKVKLTMRKAYGWKSYEIAEIALYHNLGALPRPEFTHRFS